MADPVILASLALSNPSANPRIGERVGDFLYLVDTDSTELVVVDVSDPMSMVERGSVAITGPGVGTVTSSVGMIARDNDRVYVGTVGKDSLNTYDVSDPDNPTEIDVLNSVDTDGLTALAFAGTNRIVGVSTNADNFIVVDIDPANARGGLPQIVGNLTIADVAAPVYLGSDVVLVGSITGVDPAAINTIDISTPSAPAVIDSHAIAGLNIAHKVAVHGQYAFFPGLATLNVASVDVSDPANLSTGDVHDDAAALDGNLRDVLVVGAGNYIVIPNDANNRVTTINVTDPLNMTTSGTLQDATNLENPFDVVGYDDATGFAVLSQGGAVVYLDWNTNNPPTAADLLSPINNESIAVGETNRFEWDFNDPDAGDSQTEFDIRYRESGTAPWTELLGNVSTDTFHDFAAATFVAGKTYEWQVRTYDTSSEQGPWSSSEFFGAVARPGAPTIDAPTLDEVIGTEEYLVEWTTATQNAYQLRVVRDDGGGSPDVSQVEFDTGVVESASARTRTAQFPDNLVTRHVQLRVRHNSLWSDWASVRVDVDYTPPAVPALILEADTPTSAISVSANHPTPAGTEPDVTHMDVSRRKAGETDWTRLAAAIGPDETYVDYAVESAQEYEYKVRAYGDNGTSIESAVESETVMLKGSWIHDPSDPAGTIHQFRYNEIGGTGTKGYEVELNSYVGRTMPVAEFGEHESMMVDVMLQLDTAAEVDALRDLADRKTILLYRDKARRKVYGVIPSLMDSHAFYGGISQVQIQGVEYSEEV